MNRLTTTEKSMTRMALGLPLDPLDQIALRDPAIRAGRRERWEGEPWKQREAPRLPVPIRLETKPGHSGFLAKVDRGKLNGPHWASLLIAAMHAPKEEEPVCICRICEQFREALNTDSTEKQQLVAAGGAQ